MNMKDPMNDLEQAYLSGLRGPEGRPDLFRQLRESILAFLMPYHPELEEMMELEGGDALSFIVWEGPKGSFVPIFTSMERAEQAVKQVGAEDTQQSLAEMPGEMLFKVLTTQQRGVVINPACGMGEMFLDLNAVKMLADGSILKPIATGAKQGGGVKIVDPADYPTDFIQPLFRFLRGRAEVKAAWLLQRDPAPDPAKPFYIFGLLATGDAEQLEQDFAVVAQSSRLHGADFGVILLDVKIPKMAAVMAKFPPVYAAPDFCPPKRN